MGVHSRPAPFIGFSLVCCSASAARIAHLNSLQIIIINNNYYNYNYTVEEKVLACATLTT